MPRLDIDPSQNSLIKNLRAYLSIQNKSPYFFEERRAGKLLDDIGFCRALSFIWGYARYLQDEPLTGKDRDDMAFWNKAIETIGGWDRRTPLDTDQQKIFDRFLTYMEGVQNIDELEPSKDFWQVSNYFSDTKNRQVQPVYSVAGIFEQDSLEELLTDLIKPQTLVEIGNFTHVVRLYLDKEGNYHYYNSNFNNADLAHLNVDSKPADFGEVVSKDIEVMVDALNFTISRHKSIEPVVPLFFQMHKLFEPGHELNKISDYPSQKKILKQYAAPANTVCTIKESSGAGIHLAAKYSIESLKYYIEKDASMLMKPNSSGLLPIHIAAVNNNKYALEEILKKGVPVDVATKKGRTPLMLVSNVESAEFLLDKGANIYTIANNYTVLNRSATYGNLELLKFLESKGADIKKLNKQGHLFFEAARSGHNEIIKYLMDNSDSNAIHLKGYGGQNMLHYAAKSDSIPLLKFLMEKGINIDSHDNRKNTPLMLAAKHGQINNVKLFLDGGANVNAININSDSALMCAAKRGHVEVIEWLIASGAQLNVVNQDNQSAIMQAMVNKKFDCVNLLLDKGANINIKNNRGDTLLMLAIQENAEDVKEIIKKLIAKGHQDDIHLKGHRGQSTLHYAAKNEAMLMLRFLVKKGIAVDSRDDQQKTPLILAAKRDRIKNVEFLLDNGANINAVDTGLNNALMGAAKKGHAKTLKFLIEKGAQLNAVNQHKQTALFQAMSNGKIDCVTLLLEKGADPNIADNQGVTPLNLAVRVGKFDLVNRLLNSNAHVDLEMFTVAANLPKQASAILGRLLTHETKNIDNNFVRMYLGFEQSIKNVGKLSSTELTAINVLRRALIYHVDSSQLNAHMATLTQGNLAIICKDVLQLPKISAALSAVTVPSPPLPVLPPLPPLPPLPSVPERAKVTGKPESILPQYSLKQSKEINQKMVEEKKAPSSKKRNP